MSQKKNSKPSRTVPMRTCIGTGVKSPKSEMIRLVRLNEGDKYVVEVDITGRKKGRGANLSISLEAFDKAIKKNAISRHLQLERSLSQDEIEKLRQDFKVAMEEKKFRKGNKPVILKIKKEELQKKLS